MARFPTNGPSGQRIHRAQKRRPHGYCAVRDIQPGVHLVIVRDITERRQFEQNLAENQLRLEALSSHIVEAQEDDRSLDRARAS